MFDHPILTALIGAVVLTLLILAITSVSYHVTALLDRFVVQPLLVLVAKGVQRADRLTLRAARHVDNRCPCLTKGRPTSDDPTWCMPECNSWQTRLANVLFRLSERLDVQDYRPLANAIGCWSYEEAEAFLIQLGDVPPHPSVAHPDNPWLYANEEA